MEVLAARTDADVLACFAVMKALRPHLEEASFVSRVRRQEAQGYRLVSGRNEGRVVAAAGYRLAEFLAWGKVLYIDDLITDPGQRGHGFGGVMMDWLIARAREEGCAEVHLDTGYQRHAAHRLYLKKGLELNCHHLALKLGQG
jgi:GNAT superfamily N-acetyltransferase